MIKRLLYPASVAASVGLLGLAAPHVQAHTKGTPRFQPHEIEAAKESIALSLLGQLQMSVGDLMWLKSMEYLHIGVVQRMPTRAEEEFGYRKRDSLDTAAGLGHTEGVNMTLDPDRDWRGVFGDIERVTQPYIEGHKHDDPVELIPWYQLAVRMNPSLERLYTLGAFYLADFAHEPGEAREMLEAGIEANPQSFEISSALGRLYVDFADRLDELDHHHDHDHDDEHHDEDDHHDGDDHHEDDEHHDDHHHDDYGVETPEQAHNKAIELLTRATELAALQRAQMAERRELFDDFQNQVFGEAFLYLSKAHLALGNYDAAIAAADTGFDTVSQYGQRNLLKVQGRVARRAQQGESLDEADLNRLAGAREKAMRDGVLPESSVPSNADWVEAPPLPVSVLAGIAPPDSLPGPPQDGTALAVLTDVRDYPYEPTDARATRLGIEPASLQAILSLLEAYRFVIPAGDGTHALTPPGLYVAAGRYGFDFWQAMEREAAELAEQGIVVDLIADAQKATSAPETSDAQAH